MFQKYRISGSLLACLLFAVLSTTVAFAQTIDFSEDSEYRIQQGDAGALANVSSNVFRTLAAPVNEASPEVWQPQPKQWWEQPAKPKAEQPPSDALSVSAEISLPVPEPESNMIAYWHLRDNTLKINNGTWQIEVEIRVPTSYRYKFDMEYMATMRRDSINTDGDDYYTLVLTGMSCRQPATVVLNATHDGLQMGTRNEFSYSDGPILLSHYC